jgi:redox-sensitive bicupin YhaK (pirin superfamily)
MMELRRAAERGHANHGWLDSWHSFSFADYYDPGHIQFHALRVINDDTVEPGRGTAWAMAPSFVLEACSA